MARALVAGAEEEARVAFCVLISSDRIEEAVLVPTLATPVRAELESAPEVGTVAVDVAKVTCVVLVTVTVLWT